MLWARAMRTFISHLALILTLVPPGCTSERYATPAPVDPAPSTPAPAREQEPEEDANGGDEPDYSEVKVEGPAKKTTTPTKKAEA